MVVLVLVAAAFLSVFVMVMLVLVAAAFFTVFVVMMVMLVLMAAAFFTVFVMVVLVLVAAAFLTVFVMVVMVMLFFECLYISIQGVAAFHSGNNVLAGKHVPIGGNHHSFGIVLTYQSHSLVDLLLCNPCGVAENDRACAFDLVVKEFTEILHIHLAFLRIYHGSVAVQKQSFIVKTFYRADNVRKLANARRFNDDALRCVVFNHLRKRFAKIAHERTADTARVHFVDSNTCIGKKARVNADLTKFVFDQHNLFAGVSFFEQLFDQCGLARTQKAGYNIGFNTVYHKNHLQFIFELHFSISHTFPLVKQKNKNVSQSCRFSFSAFDPSRLDRLCPDFPCHSAKSDYAEIFVKKL